MSKRIVIKLGGTSATDLAVVAALAADLAAVSREGAIVHGGGKEVSALSEQLGYAPRFANGIRMTTEPEMNLVEMVLAGLVNGRIVRAVNASGIPAIGISGSDGTLISGIPILDEDGAPSRTGRVEHVSTAPLQALWSSGFLPIIAPPAAAEDHRALNINADDVAFAIAAAVEADALVFLSDVPGVLVEESVERLLDADRVADLIAAGAISGGMIPKVQNAVTATDRGVRQVVIGKYENAGDLQALLSGESGSSISAAPGGAKGGDQ
jgi:acetylglutamate kinase